MLLSCEKILVKIQKAELANKHPSTQMRKVFRSGAHKPTGEVIRSYTIARRSGLFGSYRFKVVILPKITIE